MKRFLIFVLSILVFTNFGYSQNSPDIQTVTGFQYGMSSEDAVAYAKELFPDTTLVTQTKFSIFNAGLYMFSAEEGSFDVYKRISNRNPVQYLHYNDNNLLIISVGNPPKDFLDVTSTKCKLFFLDDGLVAIRFQYSTDRGPAFMQSFISRIGYPTIGIRTSVRNGVLHAWLEEGQIITYHSDDSLGLVIDYVQLPYYEQEAALVEQAIINK
jgi:hypothetical protein